MCVAIYTMLSINLNNSFILKISGNQPFAIDNAYLLQLQTNLFIMVPRFNAFKGIFLATNNIHNLSYNYCLYVSINFWEFCLHDY